MKHHPLISIVVPIYNVCDYLDECIESIVSQTYRNLEIILVNDGSTDNSGNLCDIWASKDDRISVIHKQNGGLSDARNAGMLVAKGELIGFVDSDDYIRNDMYELLYNNMVENNSDISACGVQMFWDDNTPSRMLTRNGCYVLNTEEALLSIIAEKHLLQPVWYKLYKQNLIYDISFPIGKLHEDVYWSYQAIGNAKTISIFDTPCYFYRQRSGSISEQTYSLKRLDAFEGKYFRLQYVIDNFPAIADEAIGHMWFTCIYTTQMIMRYLSKEEERKVGFSKVNEILSQHPIRPFAIKGITLKQRVWLCLAKISFKTTCKIRNFLNIGF